MTLLVLTHLALQARAFDDWASCPVAAAYADRAADYASDRGREDVFTEELTEAWLGDEINWPADELRERMSGCLPWPHTAWSNMLCGNCAEAVCRR